MALNEHEFFDRKRFASWLKETRKQAGFKSAKAFSKAVEEMTGLCLTEDIIYKIENGRQDITVAQLAAFSFVLFSRYLNYSMMAAVQACICRESRAYQHAAVYLAACEELSELNALIEKGNARGYTDESEYGFVLDMQKTAEERRDAARAYLPDNENELSALISDWHRMFDENPLVDTRYIFDSLGAAYDKEPDYSDYVEETLPEDYYEQIDLHYGF